MFYVTMKQTECRGLIYSDLHKTSFTSRLGAIIAVTVVVRLCRHTIHPIVHIAGWSLPDTLVPHLRWHANSDISDLCGPRNLSDIYEIRYIRGTSIVLDGKFNTIYPIIRYNRVGHQWKQSDASFTLAHFYCAFSARQRMRNGRHFGSTTSGILSLSRSDVAQRSDCLCGSFW